MTWQGRNLPGNWGTLRLKRFEHDHWSCVDCGWHDPTGRTLECDHIGDPDDHRIDMLRTRCGRTTPNNCHGKRTTQQSQQARGVGPTRLRPTQPHPGLR